VESVDKIGVKRLLSEVFLSESSKYWERAITNSQDHALVDKLHSLEVLGADDCTKLRVTCFQEDTIETEGGFYQYNKPIIRLQ